MSELLTFVLGGLDWLLAYLTGMWVAYALFEHEQGRKGLVRAYSLLALSAFILSVLWEQMQS